MDDLKYWIALRLVPNVGEVLFKNLVLKFGTPGNVFEAKPAELQTVDGIGEKTIGAIRNFREWDRAENEVSKIKNLGFKLIPLTDSKYPPNLFNIYNPPPFLYVKGDILPGDDMAIAIVGTRVPDRYGRFVTDNLAQELAARGVTVVSGMARGIDSIAHAGALKRGGRTLSVLGSGLDVIYPPENKRLYDAISKQGAVISELPIGATPDSLNFPKRNRIISGLSLGVAVIQASDKSGSLITATFAIEQNREVFAVPGNIGTKLSQGTNKLIKRGAKLVESVEDILVEIESLRKLPTHQSSKESDARFSELSREEGLICSVIKDKPLHIDKITQLAGIDSARALSVLLSLELKGLIVQMPGKIFKTRNLK